MTAFPTTRLTLDEYLAMPDYERYEWVDGRLVERPMSWLTSWIGMRLGRLLAGHAEEHGLGFVAGADNGLALDPANPRAFRFADASFTRRERVPGGPALRGHQAIPPDLVVEVVSPGDSAQELDLKLQEYLDAGVRLIWVVHPETRTVDVLRPDGRNSRLREGDTLGGEDVVPGFSLPVARIFEGMPTDE